MNTALLYQRQLDILTPEKAEKEAITIIGAGATGSFVALTLAKMGFKDITVYDKDNVELHNLPNQFFPVSCLGDNKALALQATVEDFTAIKIKAIPEMFEDQKLSGIVISALDSMSGRKLIFERCIKDKVKLLIDPRAGAEVVRVFTIDPNISFDQKFYRDNWFEDSAGLSTPCTAAAIIYSVQSITSFICNQVKRYVMMEDFKKDIYMDLINHVFFVK
jgi:molybdopterin/thiamine biosynthesis adenylyltransferase